VSSCCAAARRGKVRGHSSVHPLLSQAKRTIRANANHRFPEQGFVWLAVDGRSSNSHNGFQNRGAEEESFTDRRFLGSTKPIVHSIESFDRTRSAHGMPRHPPWKPTNHRSPLPGCGATKHFRVSLNHFCLCSKSRVLAGARPLVLGVAIAFDAYVSVEYFTGKLEGPC